MYIDAPKIFLVCSCFKSVSLVEINNNNNIFVLLYYRPPIVLIFDKKCAYLMKELCVHKEKSCAYLEIRASYATEHCKQ